MISVYWFHDALIGYSILIPFKALAILHPLSRAHMYLLYNNRFVKVRVLAGFSAVLAEIYR